MSPCANKGFTLLEVILALVLTAILAAIAGAGVVSGFNLFAAARDNTHITQKANLALNRLTRELREITDVHGVDTDRPYLIYDRIEDGANVRNAVALNNGIIKFFSNVGSITAMDDNYIDNNGNILIDNVAAFSLHFYSSHPNADDDTNTWQTSPSFDPLRELSAIQFEFTITRNTMGGRSTAFGNTVHLRNNNNFGGAAPNPSPPTQDSYACFIATSHAATPVRCWWLIFPLSLLSLTLFMRSRRQPPGTGLKYGLPVNSNGAALIAVIVVLVVFSALAVIMLPMITTSQYTQLGQDAASKAYYLAESGYRYAASQYLNAGSDSDKNDALESLHNQKFNLSGSTGSFELQVYPYYGYVQSDPGGGGTLTIRLPGELTTNLVDDDTGYDAFSGSGRLQIGREFFSYDSGDTSSAPDIRFTMAAPEAPMPSVPVGTDVYFVGQTKADAQPVLLDGTATIEMAAGSTNTFPLLNGEVVIDDNVYAYRENRRDSTPYPQLVGITDPEDPTAPALNLAPNTDVILSKFVDLQSTGSVGGGSIEGERLLTYHVPLPTSKFAQHRLEFRETFDDLSHWTNIWGNQDVADIGGDNAMAISGYNSTISLPRISLAALDWRTTEINLRWIHQHADYFLSYDAQVKIGFKDRDLPSTPTPYGDFTPEDSDIPTFFAAGISFRLDENDDPDTKFNAYGLSLMRGNVNEPSPHDNLPNELFDASFNNKLVILLWQQADEGNGRTWLAYEPIGDVEMFSEDVELESSTNDWTVASPWSISSDQPHDGAISWHFDRDGVTDEATLESPDIAACDYDYLWLSYYSRYAKAEGDILTVEYSYDGSVWTEVERIDDEDPDSVTDWERREIGISVTPGAHVQIRFRYNTDTGDTASYAGWFIDDIRVGGDWPVQEATLALRIQEAPSIEFSGGGPHEIKVGDQIYQDTASATVDASPILTNNDWSNQNAAGHLVLKNLSGEFDTGDFFVVGVGRVGTFAGSRERDNFIRAYYGSPKGCGTSNTDDRDYERHANPRDPEELHWPPADGEDYTADDDYFTLIQWDSDKINSVSTFERLTATQLRSNEPALITSTEPLSQTRPELGLHALGKGAENIYFDDFGLTVTYQSIEDITSPIQE